MCYNYVHCRFDDDDDDDDNLPFRKTQSMRATTNRRVQIVDSLKQRRLSNSSLDREPYKGKGCGLGWDLHILGVGNEMGRVVYRVTVQG